ncbi:MAG: transglycosylase SLT domain-containing protein [Kofleriaceae bacterium]
MAGRSRPVYPTACGAPSASARGWRRCSWPGRRPRRRRPPSGWARCTQPTIAAICRRRWPRCRRWPPSRIAWSTAIARCGSAARSSSPAAIPIARAAFAKLGKLGGSPLAAEVRFRLADCDWQDGRVTAAAAAYRGLLDADGAERHADLGVMRYRVAQVARGDAKVAALRELLLAYPTHPLAAAATAELAALTGAPPAWTASERITRAGNLAREHLWHEAVAELALVGDDVGPATKDRRDHLLGETLFDMRRRYGEAGELLLDVYPRLSSDAAGAMFRGARALSRADRDDEAITWYGKVVATYPSSAYAAEAQYLSGWLEFNRGNYRAALAPLRETLRRFGGSKFATLARWFLGMSHYLLGEWTEAEAVLDALGERGKSLEGGKGQYWLARAHQQAGRGDDALPAYRKIVARWPFSWYALLARARLAEAGVAIGPFGEETPTPATGPAVAAVVDERRAAGDPAIAAADELIAAGLGVEAGDLLERHEKAVLKRHPRAEAFALLLDRYRRAGNFHRPWMLAVVYAGRALDGPAEGTARIWWEHAYPRAYAELIDRHGPAGGNPDGYLTSIMRKESGFDPHVLSYADAQGLLQMIPATTARVAAELGLPYEAGRLYDPDFNVQTAAWYIGNLLRKFRGQIPVGAGSFNSGPRPVMRWLDQNGARPMDEFVELVAYTQTREYMKKVTENYARYRYLYQGEVYEQPLTVDAAYVRDDLTY